jgi:hypothetical protein
MGGLAAQTSLALGCYAEEEPENPDYPKDPEFKRKFGPRGVLHLGD